MMCRAGALHFASFADRARTHAHVQTRADAHARMAHASLVASLAPAIVARARARAGHRRSVGLIVPARRERVAMRRRALAGDRSSNESSDSPSSSGASEVSGAARAATNGDGFDPSRFASEAAAAAERRVNGALIGIAVDVIDRLYAGRSYARFHALETVARVPYFSFMSVLHMYETFGWWRKADYLKVHFAETMNEYHHLLIMESLGGAERWSDRFVAQHIAVAYFWICVGQYLISPRWAYNLLEQVESHAYATYDGFLNANEDALKAQPAPRVAVQYYTKGDLYLFDEFQTGEVRGERRPKIENLYDVFVNVRNDEAEHMKTMEFCQRPGNGLRSPSSREAKVLLSAEACALEDKACEENLDASMGERSCEGLVDCVINFGTGAVETQDMKP